MTTKTDEHKPKPLTHKETVIFDCGYESGVFSMSKIIAEKDAEIERLVKDWQWALDTHKDLESKLKLAVEALEFYETSNCRECELFGDPTKTAREALAKLKDGK